MQIFFKGLNELRAIAALAVVAHHIELFKFRDSQASMFSTFFEFFISHVGKNGVYLFFVLSGFLITYLLLQEKKNNETISIKKFYLRRVFRIWPLYYLIIAISFILIPYLASNFEIFTEIPYYYNKITNPDNYSLSTLSYYLLFMPNVALYLKQGVVGSSQAWSVGVEEQFYILWPLLLLFFSKWRLPIVFLGIIIAMPVFAYFVAPIFSFEYMSIGALGAFGLFYFPSIIEKFIKKNKYLYLIIILAILVLMSVQFTPYYIQSIVLSVLFIGLILTTVIGDESRIFKSRTLSFLGRISYGIYMYHPFIMFLMFPLANRYFQSNIIIFNLFLYILIPGISILVSHLSYKYFELPFIKIKDTKFKTL